jgi:hypothetical protein
MLLVFPRSEIDRRKSAGRDFAVDRHGKGRDDEGSGPLARAPAR